MIQSIETIDNNEQIVNKENVTQETAQTFTDQPVKPTPVSYKPQQPVNPVVVETKKEKAYKVFFGKVFSYYKRLMNNKRNLKEAKKPVNLYSYVRFLGGITILVHTTRFPEFLTVTLEMSMLAAYATALSLSFSLEYAIIKAELNKLKINLWKTKTKQFDKDKKVIGERFHTSYIYVGTVVTMLSVTMTVLCFLPGLQETFFLGWNGGEGSQGAYVRFGGNLFFMILMAVVVPFLMVSFARKLSTVKDATEKKQTYSTEFREATIKKLEVMIKKPGFDWTIASRELGTPVQTLKDWRKRSI